MFDVLLQIGASKLLVSAGLAGVAWVVQRRVSHPAVTHPLWLLVLVALLLPAVVVVPVLPGEGGPTAVVSADAVLAGEIVAGVPSGVASDDGAGPGAPLYAWITENGRTVLGIVWLAVTALLFGWTLVRTLRFRRWLARTSHPAPAEVLCEVAEIGGRLDLTRMPEVRTTTAHVSPMVCWTGGSVRLVMPSFLLASLDRQELRVVLAHELAHVRRRDHLVRWMEWLACSAFWWNPVAWWARRELRAAEEASCDALGAAATKSTPRAYAKSLLRVVELLSQPPTPPTPAFASGAASARNPKALERRLTVLISDKSSVQTPRWIRSAGTAAAVCLLPFGLVYCGFADQPMPTALEEALDSPIVAGAETTARTQPAASEPQYWNIEEMPIMSLADGPGLIYMIMTESGTIGPHALADAPGLPQECRLDHPVIGECSSAIVADVKPVDLFQAWGVCVGELMPNGLDGKCHSWNESPFRLATVVLDRIGLLAGPNSTGE